MVNPWRLKKNFRGGSNASFEAQLFVFTYLVINGTHSEINKMNSKYSREN